MTRSLHTLILITNEGMGHGEASLQHKLIQTYLGLLNESDMLPGAIACYSEGVKLVVEGSPVLDLLKSLESKGVHVIVCSTCLAHYGLTERVRVGIVGGMPDIIAAQWEAEKVITI